MAVQAPPAGALHMSWPEAGQAAVLVGDNTAASSPNAHIAPIASTTKLVTALAILEKKPLKEGDNGESIPFTAADVHIYQEVIAQDGAGIAVEAGQSMTERQALTAMILASANNIAISLANWAFGSEAAYADYANEMLSRQGFSQTHITSASGLQATTTSTPAELAKLARLTAQSPILSAITALPETIIPGWPTIPNINHASGLLPAVHALKVGLTDEAGSCLVFWVDAHVGELSVPVYGAILGQQNFRQVTSYVNYLAGHLIPSNLSAVTIAPKGGDVAGYTDKSGARITLTASQDITAAQWAGQPLEMHLSHSNGESLVVNDAGGTQQYSLARSAAPSLAITWRLLHPR